MSDYFQRLLNASGIGTAAPLAARDPRTDARSPFPEEVAAERSVESPSPRSIEARAEGSSSRQGTMDTGVSRDGAFRARDPGPAPGVVEIASVVESAPAPTLSTQSLPSPPPPASAPFPPGSDVSRQALRPNEKAAAPPLATPPPLSGPELIQHVFRWVGENPADSIPSALGRRPPIAASAGIKASAAPAASPPADVPLPAAAWPAALPGPSAAVPARPPAPALAPESTVEISIGTLQIHVDPPAGPKAARRPAAPRPPARGLPPAAGPAIDLNRLRRGFYL